MSNSSKMWKSLFSPALERDDSFTIWRNQDDRAQKLRCNK